MLAVYLKAQIARLRAPLAHRRLPALVAALGVLSVALVGCQAVATPTTPDTGSSQTLISTPNPAQQTPTPTFPPFTVGAWPSNFSPNANDTITIYVLCRIQPSDMTQPPTPAPGLDVTVQPQSPVGGSYTGKTDAHGLAAISITFNDTQPGTPVQVVVYVTYQGHSYQAKTFFTPSPNAASPTPSASPGASPSPTTGAGG